MMDASRYFITGGTLAPDAASYVRRDADERLCAALLAGEYCYVLDTRQVGKSSLMIRAAACLRESGVAVAVLDLTEVGQNVTVEQWYYGLVRRIGDQLGTTDCLAQAWKGASELSPLQRMMLAVRIAAESAGKPLVIFVDEIDAVRSLPFAADEFLAAIRECHNRRADEPLLAKLTFCLLGVATPADLVADPNTTPFNVGRRIELLDFTQKEATPLAAALSRDGHDGTALLKRVLYWTGGHPYLTQRLCATLAENAATCTPRDVDRLCATLFFSHHAREIDDNLAFVRNRILRSGEDVAALLDLYARARVQRRQVTDDPTSPLVSVLKLAGIVVSRSGYLRPRNRIYERAFDAEWIRTNMPDAELRRQRAAYWRGIARVGLVAAVVVAAVSALAIRYLWLATAYERANRRARDEEHVARVLRGRAQTVATAKAAEAHRADVEKGNAIAALASAAESARNERRMRYMADISLAQAEIEADPPNPRRAREILAGYLQHAGDDPDLRGFEWSYLWRVCNPDCIELRGHDGYVFSASYSQDGKSIVTVGQDGAARIWDSRTGRERASLRGESGPLCAAGFRPGGRSVVTVSLSGVLATRDARTGRRQTRLRSEAVSEAVLSRDAQSLLAIRGTEVALYDVGSGSRLLGVHGRGNAVTTAALSQSANRFAVASDDGTVQVWDRTSAKPPLSFGARQVPVSGMAFSPDERALIVGRANGTSAVVRLSDGTITGTMVVGARACSCVAVSRNGKRIAFGTVGGDASIWDAATLRETQLLVGHTSGVSAIDFSQDGTGVVTSSWDGTARIWQLTRQGPADLLVPSQNGYTSAMYSADGRRVLTTDGPSAPRLWDTRTGRVIRPLTGHLAWVEWAGFSQDGSRALTAGYDGEARIWDGETGALVRTLRPHAGPVRTGSFSRDGNWVVTAADRAATVWNARSGRNVTTVKATSYRLTGAGMSPDGSSFVTTADDGRARIYESRNGQVLHTLSTASPPSPGGKGGPAPLTSASFSPDGKLIVTTSEDGSAVVWQSTGRVLRVLRGHRRSVLWASFSPDGARLLTASADGTARLWDVASGRELLVLRGHTGDVTMAMFRPDGRQVITASRDGTIKVWDSDPGWRPHAARSRITGASSQGAAVR